MFSQGLYDWLMKIVSKTGSTSEHGELDFGMDERGDDAGHHKRSDKDKDRVLLGRSPLACERPGRC